MLDALGDFFLQTPIWVDSVTSPTKYYPAYFNTSATSSTGTTAAAGAGGKGAAPAPVAGKPAAAPQAAGAGGQPASPTGAAGSATSLKPTAATVNKLGVTPAVPLFPLVALVNQGAAQGQCGVDSLKAHVIETLGQGAALEAGGVGGLATGALGGTGVSFVVFQKISIGDNQTLQQVVKTLLSKVAERVAAEGAYRVLINFNDQGYSDFASLVLAILDKSNSAATPAPAAAAH